MNFKGLSAIRLALVVCYSKLGGNCSGWGRMTGKYPNWRII